MSKNDIDYIINQCKNQMIDYEQATDPEGNIYLLCKLSDTVNVYINADKNCHVWQMSVATTDSEKEIWVNNS